MSNAQLPNWPTGFGNITPDPTDPDKGTALLDGHNFTITALRAYSTADLNSGPATVSVSMGSMSSFSLQINQYGWSNLMSYFVTGGGSASGSVPLDQLAAPSTAAEYTGAHTPSLERHLYVDSIMTATGTSNYNGLPFIAYQISTTDPAEQNATLKVRFAHGGGTYGGARGRPQPFGPFGTATASATIASLASSISSAGGWLEDNKMGPYWATDTYSTVTLVNGVGIVWTNLSVQGTANAGGNPMGMAESKLDSRVKPYAVMWP